MTKSFRTLDDVDVKGKRVLLRVDLNVPMENGRVTDATGSSALRRPSPKSRTRAARSSCSRISAGPRDAMPRNSLKPVAAALSQVIKKPVGFADDCIGEAAAKAVGAMKDGDILCLENTRFHKEEEKNDPAFVAELAKLGDIWVNDAFSAAHRAHASTEGLGHKLPAYAGRTMQAELDALAKALEAPTKPVIAIIGGAKVSTKIDLLENLVTQGRRAGDRRRHGQHLPARAGRRRRQIAGGEGPRRDRAADHGKGGSRQLRRSSCRSMPWSPIISRPTRRPMPMASTRSRPTA